ncbi:DUF4389 domain-containing protein [Natronospira bacteriovora]|uniref:DUF4389 domain-containing protein n=1 Tax=Natronospira bacteriovora TaxID=3069753 RepID=A0ABU0W9H3_9GAMM|nr:DUF4389 domain-containing protein [Natronospira sp. AB-CW4]MDQ2070670.1 DUF4389 domain-containing protein [Natronospira sp. AB-CW4]
MKADEFDPDEIREHVKSRATWLRLVYMIIFLFFAWVATFVFGVVILVLFLWQLFAGQPNAQLRAFGDNLSTWGYQVLRFLSFNSEDLPFPFDAWPSGSVKTGGGTSRSRKKASKKKKTASSTSGAASGSRSTPSGGDDR